MTSVDIGEVVFLVVIFAIGVGGFLKVMLNEDDKWYF